MQRTRLLLPQLQLPPHHRLKVIPRLYRPQIIRRAHDVLAHHRQPLDVPLPLGRVGRGGAKWRCEEGFKQVGVGDEH